MPISNQRKAALQVAVGVLAVALFGTGTVAYYFASAADALEDRLAQQQADITQVKHSLETVQRERSRLLELIGFSSTTALQEVEETYQSDVASYAADPAANHYSYRQLLEQFALSKLSLNQRLVDLMESNRELTNRFTAMEMACQARLDVVQEKMVQLLEENAVALQDEGQERLRRVAEDLATELEKRRAEMNDLIAKHNAELIELQKKVTDQDRVNEALRKKLAEVESAEAIDVDGQVTWVSARLGRVWLNVGRADKVMSQMTFGVYPAEGGIISGYEPKGSIRIVRLVDEHTAEAQITADKTSDPIIPGDVIHSPIWDPGQPQSVAIAGFIDLDGDGHEDREKLRSIISIQGGTVDAEVLASGILRGDISVETRYLVLGRAPDEASENATEAYAELLRKAEKLNVERISIQEFLARLGLSVGEHGHLL